MCQARSITQIDQKKVNLKLLTKPMVYTTHTLLKNIFILDSTFYTVHILESRGQDTNTPITNAQKNKHEATCKTMHVHENIQIK